MLPDPMEDGPPVPRIIFTRNTEPDGVNLNIAPHPMGRLILPLLSLMRICMMGPTVILNKL